jgi:hypothetical protein
VCFLPVSNIFCLVFPFLCLFFYLINHIVPMVIWASLPFFLWIHFYLISFAISYFINAFLANYLQFFPCFCPLTPLFHVIIYSFSVFADGFSIKCFYIMNVQQFLMLHSQNGFCTVSIWWMYSKLLILFSENVFRIGYIWWMYSGLLIFVSSVCFL